jgi:DNA-binding CsgD family transcriptional regulator
MHIPSTPKNIYDMFGKLAGIQNPESFSSTITPLLRKIVHFQSGACILASPQRGIINKIYFDDNAENLVTTVFAANTLDALQANAQKNQRSSLFCDVSTQLDIDSTTKVVADFHALGTATAPHIGEDAYCCFFWRFDRDIRRHDFDLITFIDLQLRSKMVQLAYYSHPQKRNSGILSPREHEVIQWIAKGKSTEEISIMLGISYWTVKTHVKKLLIKLNANKRSDAVSKAFQMGLIQNEFPVSTYGGQALYTDVFLPHRHPNP